jgi:hypothetical protein
MGNICGNPVREKNEGDQFNADGMEVPKKRKETAGKVRFNFSF